MTRAAKDPYKLNLILTALFILGGTVSAYFLYRLPKAINIPYGYESEFNIVYLLIGATFLLGILVLTQAMSYKQELIVYRDKSIEQTKAEQESTEQKNRISIEGITLAIQAAKSTKEVLEKGLDAICKQLDAGQGAAYITKTEGESKLVELKAGFAFSVNENAAQQYAFGEGLIGQAAASGQLLYLDELPEGYIKIISGLGSASPRFLIIVPVKKENQTVGILELASFTPFTEEKRKFIEQSAQLIAERLLN
jgi:transcriptional regulator with GAF, ATPase, and Fis domain